MLAGVGGLWLCRVGSLEKATTDAITWNRTMENKEANLKNEVRYMQDDVANRNKILKDWKPGKGV